MCQALRELMKDEIEEEIAEATAEVTADTKLDDIRKMMKNLKLSAVQVMQALEIPEAEQATFTSLL